VPRFHELNATNAPAALHNFVAVVKGNAGEAQHLDVQFFASSTRRFEILAAVVAQAEISPFRAVDCLTTSAWRSS
jgi:hypothetical protein